MFELSNKTVLLISPERWGKMRVSKHHYALELAKNNCNVFFLEPPANNLADTCIVKECPDHKGIKIIQYRPVFKWKRLLPAFIFRLLLRKQVQIILKAIGSTPDVVICFQGYLFLNLKWFHAEKIIFFAADQFENTTIPPEIQTADLVLAVSDTIQKRIADAGFRARQINHGLQPAFVELARKTILTNKNTYKGERSLAIGYVGNLRMQALDRLMMMNVIRSYPQHRFLFWGSYKQSELNLGGVLTDEANSFIDFLVEAPNVELRGVVSGDELLTQMLDCDLFWLCWQTGIYKMWDGSNSHKILEYLATGKPVVSHYVSSYKDTGLLYMLQDADNSGYAELFQQVINLVQKGESEDVRHKRLQFALDNSYANQLNRIEQFL